MVKQMNYHEDEGLSLLEWCNKLADEEGYELKFTWDGGNDEGWVNFYIDDNEIENKYTRALIEYCYDVLDYGSWAGDFSASGDAVYDSSQGAFVGEDRYSTDELITYPCRLDISIPKDIWFDTLDITIDEENVQAKFNVRNGFTTEDHVKVCEEIENSLEDSVEKVISKFSNEYEYSRHYTELELNKEDFQTKPNGELVHTITSLDITSAEYDDKDVYIDVEEAGNKYLKNED